MTSLGRNADTASDSIVGSLDSWPLADILLWMHQSSRTAMLRVGQGLNAGVVFFKDGHLYRCEWGHLGGEQALLALMSITTGAFSMIQREFPSAVPNVNTPTTQLLLEVAVAKDEIARRQSA